MPTQDSHDDPARGERLRSDLAGDETFAPLLTAYVATVPAKREELAAAVGTLSENPAPLREVAHRLKGNAGGYGFPSVTAAAKAVVVACRESRLADARAAAKNSSACRRGSPERIPRPAGTRGGRRRAVAAGGRRRSDAGSPVVSPPAAPAMSFRRPPVSAVVRRVALAVTLLTAGFFAGSLSARPHAAPAAAAQDQIADATRDRIREGYSQLRRARSR